MWRDSCQRVALFQLSPLPLTNHQPNPCSQAGVMLGPEYASFLTPHLTLPVMCKTSQTPTFILMTPENISNPNFLWGLDPMHLTSMWYDSQGCPQFGLTLNPGVGAHLLVLIHYSLWWWRQVANQNLYLFFLSKRTQLKGQSSKSSLQLYEATKVQASDI